FRRAIPLLRTHLAINEKDSQTRANLAAVMSMVQEKESALAELRRALEAAPNDGYVVSRAILVYEQAGMREQALAMIPQAISANSLTEIENWPSLEQLRRDPRYTEMVKRYSPADAGQ